MRIGWDADHLTGVEVAKQVEANGADLIAVHGRTREQMYIPPIDTAAIAAIKQAVSVPVLANGDVTTADGAVALLQETGCDGVMIGRGARVTHGCLSRSARRFWARNARPSRR